MDLKANNLGSIMKLNRAFSMQDFKKKYDLVENQKSIKIILLIIMIGLVEACHLQIVHIGTKFCLHFISHCQACMSTLVNPKLIYGYIQSWTH